MVTVKVSGEEAQRLKAFMHNCGRDEIRKQLTEYIRSLKEEFSKGLILPKKGEPQVKADNVSTITSGMLIFVIFMMERDHIGWRC